MTKIFIVLLLKKKFTKTKKIKDIHNPNARKKKKKKIKPTPKSFTLANQTPAYMIINT